jgi:outer membrane lipoprotein-sorting protein
MNSFAKNYSSLRLDNQTGSFRLLLLLVLPAVALLASCAPVRMPAPTLAPVSAGELLQSLRAQGQRHQTLQGTVSLRMTHNGERHSVKQVLLLQRPDMFRAEVLGPFGQPVMTVAAAGNRLSAFIPGESRFYSGPATPENLYRLVRLPLEVKQLVQFVFYDVPLLPESSGGVSLENGFYVINRESADGRRQELRFDEQRRLRQVRYFSNQTELLQATYDNVRDEDGLPLTLRLNLPGDDMEVELVWRDVRSNGELLSSRFYLVPPPGVQVLALP